MKKDLRIVFMGSPKFAVASLEAILSADYNVVGVITAPDKVAGRGKQIRKTDVKEFAEKKGLNLLQPENLKDPLFLKNFKALNPNLGIVVAFRMLPEVVWAYPEYGTFNLHASLLPQYRGAAPINHAIIKGETETGVTTFFLTHEIDTGNVIYREKLPIGELETFGQLHDRMMVAGAALVLKTVEAIQNDSIRLTPQCNLFMPGELLNTAPKIFKEDCRIDWTLKAKEIHNLVRGLSPVPSAFTHLISPSGEQFQMKIIKTTFREIEHQQKAGSIKCDNKKEFGIFTKDGIVLIDELQLAGKKSLSVNAFLNGFKLTPEWKVR
ncbi:MAG: methionyl-tRNA formyltransferase [Bacteroidales bacterium]|nr:methionyl-tRNA formyltransferase [Bacteroidales bacterium]